VGSLSVAQRRCGGTRELNIGWSWASFLNGGFGFWFLVLVIYNPSRIGDFKSSIQKQSKQFFLASTLISVRGNPRGDVVFVACFALTSPDGRGGNNSELKIRNWKPENGVF
jgi:hypothetical protein